MTLSRRFSLLALCLLGCCLLAACGGEQVGGLRVILETDGQNLSRFAIIASAPDANTVLVECGTDETVPADTACLSNGIELSNAKGTLRLVAKAPGFHTSSLDVKVADLPIRDGVAEAMVVLPALADCAVTPDYRTCVAGEGFLEELETMAYPADSEFGPSYSIKFYIKDLQNDPTVYFQNTQKHPIHYDFAHEVLGIAQTPNEYVMATYVGEDRTAMAGTLVYYPALDSQLDNLAEPLVAPIAMTFFPSDNLTPQQALLAYRLIEERIGFLRYAGGNQRLGYLPAGSVQDLELAAATAQFAAAGALYMGRTDLYADITMQLLNPGIAYGKLRLLSPEELSATVVSFGDILLLTRLPNELPIVGGTITEEMQTPLAHVNVAAQTRGTPNMALVGASEEPAIAALLGKLVRLEVTSAGYSLQETTLAEAEEYWKSIKKPPVAPEADDATEGLPGFANLHFADSIFVGVKAANLAELHNLLTKNAPDGFGVPFHYYFEFMTTSQLVAADCMAAHADCIAEGRTATACGGAADLCLAGALPETLWEHATRVCVHEQFKSDSQLRDAVLDGLRYHIRNTPVEPSFGALLDARVTALAGEARVRLRSSTNSEDLEEFSGAGLYDSTSAYAQGEDAASQRIRKVWASVWGWRAFEERSFWNIDHFAVRMGVCVNPAFTDEKANGVLITQNIADPMTVGMYVNVQLGEGAVTNPDAGELPEVFAIVPGPGGGVQIARQRFSSLSPGVPILSDAEVTELFQKSSQAHEHFAKLYGKYSSVMALDIEFKFHGPERHLYLKQARPYTDW